MPVEPGPPSPSLSSTTPQGKGAVGGADPKGASEESQRPEYFGGKDGDYNDKQGKVGSAGGAHPAEKAADAAEILNRKADEDKASRTNA